MPIFKNIIKRQKKLFFIRLLVTLVKIFTLKTNDLSFNALFYTLMITEPIWKSWFARHGTKLLLFARQQARNPHDAEDLVQEAFVRIWRLYGHTG